MTTFDKRENEFERKFVHDEELRFKAAARRNKMLGLWAADKLGLSGAGAETYANEVVRECATQGEDDVFAKIRRDFQVKAITVSDHRIRRTMDELMLRAVADIKAGR